MKDVNALIEQAVSLTSRYGEHAQEMEGVLVQLRVIIENRNFKELLPFMDLFNNVSSNLDTLLGEYSALVDGEEKLLEELMGDNSRQPSPEEAEGIKHLFAANKTLREVSTRIHDIQTNTTTALTDLAKVLGEQFK